VENATKGGKEGARRRSEKFRDLTPPVSSRLFGLLVQGQSKRKMQKISGVTWRVFASFGRKMH
jgi:hypothetical protein